MQEPFGGERFKYSLLLVLFNRLVTVAVAAFLLVTSGQDIRPVAPPQAYAAVSVSNVVATFCQYEALKHVSFPLQTLGKCAKMIPVMVWGTFIMRKRYSEFTKGGMLLGCMWEESCHTPARQPVIMHIFHPQSRTSTPPCWLDTAATKPDAAPE